MNKRLLDVRADVKKRKPKFKRQQSNQFAKFKNDDSWRKPKGYQSKIRLKRKGHQRMPCVGFKSPRLVRGLNKDGFKEVLVYNVFDLKKVDVKTQIPVIARTVGARKRIDILNQAKKLKLSFANVFDIDLMIKNLTLEKKVVKSKKEEAKVSDKKDVKANSKLEEVEKK